MEIIGRESEYRLASLIKTNTRSKEAGFGEEVFRVV